MGIIYNKDLFIFSIPEKMNDASGKGEILQFETQIPDYLLRFRMESMTIIEIILCQMGWHIIMEVVQMDPKYCIRSKTIPIRRTRKHMMPLIRK